MKRQVVVLSVALMMVLQQLGLSTGTFAADRSHPPAVQRSSSDKTLSQKPQTISPAIKRPVGGITLRPLVTSSSPNVLKLVAGADATAVTLSGSNLNLISGAQIRQGNVPANQLAVRLVGSATAATARFELRALANAATGPCTLVLLQGNKAFPVPANALRIVVFPEQVELVFAPKPASIVPGTLPAAGNSNFPPATGTAGGQGRGSGGGGPIPQQLPDAKMAVAENTRFGLPGGETPVLSTGPGIGIAQPKTVLNIPDLIIVNLEQETGILKAMVKLLDNPAGESRTLDLKFDIYVSGNLDGRTQGQPVTFTGSTAVWVYLAGLNVASGWKTIKVHVNPDKAVVEKNYENNVMEEALSFNDVPAPGLPDFYIKSLYVSQGKQIVVKIGNQGIRFQGVLTIKAEPIGAPLHYRTITPAVSIQPGGFADVALDLSQLGENQINGEWGYPLQVTVNPEGANRVREIKFTDNAASEYFAAHRLFSLNDIAVYEVRYQEQGITLREGQLISVEYNKEYTLKIMTKNKGDGAPDSDVVYIRSCGNQTYARSIGNSLVPGSFNAVSLFTLRGAAVWAQTLRTSSCKIAAEYKNSSVDLFHYLERTYN